VALRYEKTREEREKEETEQYQLFETSQYKYRVFVTDFSEPIDFVVWFYNQRGGAENLIKEANNDAGLAAHPSGRFDVNCNHFQLAMLAYNLNCWLMLFNREPQADATQLRAHDAGDLAAALPVRGRQDLAPRRAHRGELQRSVRGEGRVRAANGAAAPDRAARAGLCAGDGAAAALIGTADPGRAVHRILCTASKRNGASNFGAGLGGIGLSGGVMK